MQPTTQADEVIKAGELEIRPAEFLVLAGGRALTLSVRELDLLAALGRGDLGVHRLALAIQQEAPTALPSQVPVRTAPVRLAPTEPGAAAGIVVEGVSNLMTRVAKCCQPVPPDPILGFVTKGGGVSVHRMDCTNAASLLGQPERVLEVEWAPTSQSTFLVNIQVEALDRARLLSDITMAISDAHVNILSATLSTTRDRVAKSRFSFEMADAAHLDNVLRAVRGVPGVFDAYRVTS